MKNRLADFGLLYVVAVMFAVVVAGATNFKALAKTGKPILDLTVGDFSSKQFPIPIALENAIVDALRAGESTYPPGIGVEALRQAIREFYHRRLGLQFPLESVLVASGGVMGARSHASPPGPPRYREERRRAESPSPVRLQ